MKDYFKSGIKTLLLATITLALLSVPVLAQNSENQNQGESNAQPAEGAAGPLAVPVPVSGEQGTVSLILVLTNKDNDRLLGNVFLTIGDNAFKGPTPDPPPSRGYIIGGIKEGEQAIVAERVGYKIYHKTINVKSEAGYMDLNIELEPLPGTPEVSRTSPNQSNYWSNWGASQLPNNYNNYPQSWNQASWNNSVLNPYQPYQQTYQQNYNSSNYYQPYSGSSSQYNPQYNPSYPWPNSSYQPQNYQYPQAWYPSTQGSRTAPARLVVGNRNIESTTPITVAVQITNQATHQAEFSNTFSLTEGVQSQYATGASNTQEANLCLTASANFTITVSATILGEQKTASNVFPTKDSQTLTTVYVVADIREGTLSQLSPFEIIARTSPISADTHRCGGQNYYPYSCS
ncbi:MAG: hypothetical protein OEV37_01675, partial [Candidatus Berkelbacteria bacterium]|nr:hypothetical protein [Candidatus Berkelbacteria bacterium]